LFLELDWFLEHPPVRPDDPFGSIRWEVFEISNITARLMSSKKG
jgi:hypothetical protein